MNDNVFLKLIESAADCLCFGALLPCEECDTNEGKGQIYFR
jgi:hypothetical protein